MRMAGFRCLPQVLLTGSRIRTFDISLPRRGTFVAGTLCKLVPVYLKSQFSTVSGSTEVKSNISDAPYWIKRWDDGDIGFHKNYLHPLLVKHASVLSNGKSSMRILFPLCGKAWDMKWLADQGYTVLGVEVSEKAVTDFFTEQSIPFTTQPISVIEGTLFQSEDGKLHIYCCDFFKFSKNIAGQMDAIWDRAALVAICRKDRKKYAALIKQLMGPECTYMLAALQFDEREYGGPPHNLSTEAVIDLFGDDCRIGEIDDVDAMEPRHVARGITAMREKLFVIARI